MTVPPEAITAVTRIAQEAEPTATHVLMERPGQLLSVLLDVARRSLEAAAPLIAAAERDRIQQLAMHRGDELADHAMQGSALPTMSAMLAAKAAALTEFADLLAGDAPDAKE